MSWNAGSIVTRVCVSGELGPAPGTVSTSGLHVPDTGVVGTEEIGYADVDPEHVAKIRSQYPFLEDRRS